MTSRETVLVTGASGFVGRQTLRILAGRGWEVHAAARTMSDDAPAGTVWHSVDLLGAGAAERLVRRVRPSALLHLAWNATPGQFWGSPGNLDWVAASLSMYRSFVASGGRRAVFCGSCAEYDWAHGLLDETLTPLRPSTLYGTAKAALYGLLMAASTGDGVDVAWGRLFFLYGPHEAPVRLVPDVILSLLEQRVARCGDGNVERDFMYVEDAATALVAVLESNYCGAVNIASGQCMRLRDVIGEVAAQVGRPDLIQFGARPTPANEPPRLAATTAILRERIGFVPRQNLTTRLTETIAWWRAQRSPMPTDNNAWQ